MTLEIIPLHSILIPEGRQRQHFDPEKLNELADSIASIGLLHPPILRNGSDTLVAGERRLRALSLLEERNTPHICAGTEVPPGHAAILRLAELDPLRLREAELEENIRRVDLTWQEREQAIADLHALRLEQTDGIQTYKATAAEVLGREPIGSEPTSLVRNATIIAQHLSDPDVAKAKSEKEAMKIITKKAERDLRNMLAEQFGATATSDNAVLENIDAVAGLRALDDETIDIILSDPPYGIGANTFGDQSDIAHNYDDSYETWIGLMDALATESYRVAKPQAHAYIFCDPRHFSYLADIFAKANWSVWSVPLIWDKGNGILPRPDHGPRRCYESILFANKGDRTTNAVYSDVIRIAPDAVRQHAAQKPVALYADLLRRSAVPGDTVLDPFSGSGTIFPAARQASCKAIGFELDPASYAIGLGRINE